MRNYYDLKNEVAKFLTDNPEIAVITMKRPKAIPRSYYEDPSKESYGRIPGTCDRVQQIIDEIMVDGETVTYAKKNQLFNKLHDEITTVFRRELDAVLHQKFDLLGRISSIIEDLQQAHTMARTERPEPKPDSNQARRRRGEHVIEVEEEESP
jgi:hypothetical protein